MRPARPIRRLGLLLLAGLLVAAPARPARADEAPAPALTDAHSLALQADLARLDLAAAQAYLAAHATAMQAEGAGLYAGWTLQLLLWEGEVEEARTQRDAALKADPTLAQAPAFQAATQVLDDLDQQPPKLLVDYELEGNQRAVQQLEREAQPLALYRRIREIIDDSRDHVVLSDDARLYPGAAPVYRRAFTPHQKGYDAYIADYLVGLGKATQMDAATLAGTGERLRLQPPPAPPTPAPALALPLPAALGEMQELGLLHDGALEHLAAYDAADTRLHEPALGRVALSPDGAWQVLQSSRQVLALRERRVAWSYTPDPTRMDPQRDVETRRNVLVTKALSPALGGSRVVARLATGGDLNLVALDLENGDRLWEIRPETYHFCSDPTIYQDRVLILARKQVMPTEYHLLELDLASGALRQSFFLFALPIGNAYWKDWGARLQLDRCMPAPVIDRGLAFISTNRGVVGAYDLSTRAMRWLRTYPTAVYALSATLADLPVARAADGPVVGGDVVLFAPLDAPRLLALDRLTGQVAGRPAWQWSGVRPLDAAHALLRSRDGRTLQVLRLADLQVLAELPAESAWHWAGAVHAPTLLQRDRTLGALDGATTTFRAGLTLPEGLRIVNVQADGLLLARREAGGFRILATGVDAAADASSVGAAATAVDEVVDGRFMQVGGTRYAVGENVIVRLDGELRPQWSCALPERPRFVVADGDHLLLTFDRYAFALNAGDGRLLRSWPDAGTPWASITAAAAAPDGALIGVGVDADTAQVLRWRHGQPETLGTLRGARTVLAILQHGQVALGERAWTCMPYELNAALGVYERASDEHVGMDMAFPYRYGWSLDDGRFVPANDWNPAAIYAGTAMARFDLTGKGVLNKHGYEYRQVHDVLTTTYWNNDVLLYVVDLRHGRDLSTELHVARPPYVDDAVIVGISSDDGYQMQGWSYDRKSGRKSLGLEMLANKSITEDLANRGGMPTDFSIRLGDTVYTVYGTRSDRPSRVARRVLMQSATSGTPEVGTLPGYITVSDAVTDGKWVVIACDQTLIRLSAAQFEGLIRDTRPLLGVVNRGYSINLDGFADEWPHTAFRDVGKNRVAVISTLSRAHIALDIRDPVLIQRLSQPGALQRLLLATAPGDALVPTAYQTRSGGVPPVRLFGPEATGPQAAWSAAPAGDRFFIEAYVDFADEGDAKWTRIFIGRGSAPDLYGDLAVDLQLLGPDEHHPESLLAPGDPSRLPRFRLDK